MVNWSYVITMNNKWRKQHIKRRFYYYTVRWSWHLGLIVPSCSKPFSSSPVHHQFVINHYQFIISSSSAHQQLIISSSLLHHHFIISLISVHHQFNISTSSVHHEMFKISPSVHHYFIISSSSSSVHHQFISSSSSVLQQFILVITLGGHLGSIIFY